MKSLSPVTQGIKFGRPADYPFEFGMSQDVTDLSWLAGIMGKMPMRFHAKIADRYRGEFKAKGQASANGWLREIGQAVTVAGAGLAASDYEICNRAKACANRVRGMLADGMDEIIGTPAAVVVEKLAAYCQEQGAILPEGAELRSIVARLTDAAWWRRQFRRSAGRQVEGFARSMGFVQRRTGLYASDETCNRHAEQKRRNLAGLENTEAYKTVITEINTETGEVETAEEAYNLAELAALGVSNPSVRFAELMVRVRGMEKHAQENGHVGLFITGTTPGKMHAVHGTTGHQNSLFDGTDPKEAQQWIARQWSRVRAALARLGVKYYGVRVCEPHHDGTPHWHMLLFIKPVLSAGRSAIGRFKAVFRRYLLRGDWKSSKKKALIAEGRAQGLSVRSATFAAAAAVHGEAVDKRRAEKADTARRLRACDFKLIDWAQGSAAGYLVKYLAKNISGQKMGMDLESGKDAQALRPGVDTAARVLAWASCWGIRQFQVVGGPPVGVWRELRKIKEKPEQLELFDAWAATGSKEEDRKPDWAGYIVAQGGIECRRDDRPVQLLKLNEPERLTKYYEPAADRVIGIQCAGVETITRTAVWQTRPAVSKEQKRRAGQDRRSFGRSMRRVWGSAFDVAPKAPRTRVNNCTSRTAPKQNALAANMAHIAKLPARVPDSGFVGPIPPGRVFCLDIFDQLRELKR